MLEKRAIAKSFMNKKKYKEAIKVLDSILLETPGDELSNLQKAICLFNQGKYRGSVEYSKKVIEINQKSVRAYQMLGYAFIQLKMVNEGLDAIKSAIALDPLLVESYEIQARLYHNQNKIPESIEIIKKALSIEPSNWSLHYMLGILLNKAKKLPESYLELKEAYRIHPSWLTFTAILELQIIRYRILFLIGISIIFFLALRYKSPLFLLPFIILLILETIFGIQHKRWFSVLFLATTFLGLILFSIFLLKL